MHDAQQFAVLVGFRVRVSASTRDAADDEDGEFEREYAVFVGELSGELFEVCAPDQFHRDEENLAGGTEMIGLDDVGVNQVGHQFGFADKVFDERLLVGVTLANDLDGDAFDEVARAVLLGLIDDTHAALKNLSNDLVAELALNREQAAHA